MSITTLTAPAQPPELDERGRLLDIPAMAVVMGTGERMARRLISERRIRTVKIGRYVRVWSADLADYLDANTRPANAPRNR